MQFSHQLTLPNSLQFDNYDDCWRFDVSAARHDSHYYRSILKKKIRGREYTYVFCFRNSSYEWVQNSHFFQIHDAATSKCILLDFIFKVHVGNQNRVTFAVDLKMTGKQRWNRSCVICNEKIFRQFLLFDI